MRRLLAAVVSVIVPACSAAGPAGPAGPGGDDAAPDAGTQVGVDDRVRDYDAIAYALRAHFDWDARRLFAVEDVTVALAAGIAPQIELDSKVEVSRVFAGDQALTWTADAAAQILHVDLTPLAPVAGAPVTFSIEYQAPTSGAFIASHGRIDDPITSRVVYTDSEPNRGVGWLVANHHPADRARFSVELTVAEGEDVIANGERVRDEVHDGTRVIGYAIDQPIPTYIMAFAAGELEHHDRAGRVPLSIWFRRGVLVDAETHLEILAAQLAAFEPLIGAYPWARYAVVLLPEFPAGGMENATITFNSEPIGQGHIGFATNAHELAHHWFGDWVTMRRFEDAWFKEGMATLMQWEAGRAHDDPGRSGRLFGNFFSFDPADAIVDPTLLGISKYTSGIYDRAAWMINQIRARVGDDAFWQSLRALLAAHALDSIDGETFVRSFAPALDEATIAQILATLPRKVAPALAVTVTTNASDRLVTLTLSDPAGAVIAPMTFTVVDAAGVAATPQALVTGVPLQLTVPLGGYLAPDEAGVHVSIGGSIELDGSTGDFFALFLPSTPAAVTALTSRSPVHQERELASWVLPVDDTGLAAFYAALDSRTARQSAENDACQNIPFIIGQGSDPGGWITALTPILRSPAVPLFDTAHGVCGPALGNAVFGDELAAMVTAITAANAERFLYLISFDYGPARTFDLLSSVVTDAPSLLIRDRALTRLAIQASTGGGYSALPDAEAPRWRSFFHARLVEARSTTRFLAAWSGAVALVDDAAPAVAGAALHALPFFEFQQRQLVCDAFHLAQQVRPAAFDELVAAAQPINTLAPSAAAAVADPTVCDQLQARALRAAPRQRPVSAAQGQVGATWPSEPVETKASAMKRPVPILSHRVDVP
jgi:aminopeptidase N